MRDVLPFMSLMKKIEFVIELQEDNTKVLCSIFEKLVTVHKDNKGATTLAVAPQMRPHTKYIMIKDHKFWSFVANSDVETQHIDTKEQIADILMKPLDSELFRYLR